MDVTLHPSLAEDPIAKRAATAIEPCVHCGFCLATCPTYLDERDERDSPRGRIYLVKQFLETDEHEQLTQRHLDRCLTCRSCETTCPSGVAYGEIAESARELLASRAPRPLFQSLLRWALRRLLPRQSLFAFALRTGQRLRPLLPGGLRGSIPRRQTPLPLLARSRGPRRVLLLEGCVQSSATPNTNRALRNVLARLRIELRESPRQGCCGALPGHLGDLAHARHLARRNIDNWWPHIEAGVDAILSSATGCAVQLDAYAHILGDDESYATKAATVSSLAMDVGDYLGQGSVLEELAKLAPWDGNGPRIALHTPCSQVHGLKSSDGAAPLLRTLGYAMVPVRNNHLCCGSAGTYSILDSPRSQRLRERKLQDLTVNESDVIATANIGCQLHLEDPQAPPVRHWIELIEEALAETATTAPP